MWTLVECRRKSGAEFIELVWACGDVEGMPQKRWKDKVRELLMGGGGFSRREETLVADDKEA